VPALSDNQLKDIVEYFKDCQFVELGPLHVVSLAKICVQTDSDGKITGGEVTLHDPDTDVVDASVNPPVFVVPGNDETFDLVKLGDGWGIDFGNNFKPPISGYVLFCPDSYKVGKAAGGKNNPQITYDPVSKTLSFSDCAINILDGVGGMSEGVEAQYATDPILGATISVTDLRMVEPWEDDPETFYFPPGEEHGYTGFVFQGGVVQITKNDQVLVEGRLGYFRVLPDAPNDVSDNFGVFTDYTISNTIESPFLYDLAAQWADENTVMDFYVEAVGFDNLSAAFNGFDVATPTSVEALYMLAKNGTPTDYTVPCLSEWGTIILALLLLTGATMKWGRRQRLLAAGRAAAT